jgi:hypothetical protein
LLLRIFRPRFRTRTSITMPGRASFCQREAALVDAIREGTTLLAGVDASMPAGIGWQSCPLGTLTVKGLGRRFGTQSRIGRHRNSKYNRPTMPTRAWPVKRHLGCPVAAPASRSSDGRSKRWQTIRRSFERAWRWPAKTTTTETPCSIVLPVAQLSGDEDCGHS